MLRPSDNCPFRKQALDCLHDLDEPCDTFGVIEIDVRAFTGLLE